MATAADSTTARPTQGAVILVLRPEPAGPDAHGADPTIRLRFVLKRLLRQYGFRCVSIAPVMSE